MRKILDTKLKYLFALSLSVFVLGGAPAEFGKEKAFFHGFLIHKPVIHVGLGINLGQIEISSSSGMKIYEAKTNYRLIADNVDEVFIKGSKEKLSETFLIQADQAKTREEAEKKAQELRTKIDRMVHVQDNRGAGIDAAFKILVGDFLTRGDALSYMARLNQLGIQDTWIIREEVTESRTRPLWILVNDELKSLNEDTTLYFIPSNPQSYLSYNGRDYRGIFTLKASRKGIVLINTLNLENYLKAVVPSELSPYSFPEIEAQKAQAVAARTYALKNLGQYRDLGFDLLDTPQSQFYTGMNAEHPLSSQAVDETRGQVAKYRGQFIDALYTSTCGGATEDVENVFLGPALPYLRGTVCVYEKQKDWHIATQRILLPIYAHGGNVSSDIALLISLGVLPNLTAAGFYREEISAQEAVLWVQNAMRLLGKEQKSAAAPVQSVNIAGFARLAVESFSWQERVANLLGEGETDFIMGDNHVGWESETKAYIAYLIKTGILPVLEDLGDPEAVITRADTVLYLANILREYQQFTTEGKFKAAGKGWMEIVEGEETKRLEVAPETFLIRDYEKHSAFVKSLHLLGGESLRYLERDGQLVFLEVLYSSLSNILDRNSKYHSWQQRYAREDLSEFINQYYPVGEVIDILPQSRGTSNRVVNLLIKGSEADATVKGFRIRRVLGLRETLFVIDREYAADGSISHFTFSGKGWGHGVGMCQVGAYAMAQSGAIYQDILKKYYRGIKLDTIY